VKTYKEKEDALVKTGGANKKRLRELKEETMTKADVKVSWLLTPCSQIAAPYAATANIRHLC